jgi:protein phosphatase 2C family protein 2/3
VDEFTSKIFYLDRSTSLQESINNEKEVVHGPHRVFPGRLSVSRTIGDIEAKDPVFGGMRGVVIAEPEVTSFTINNESDFLVLGCNIT